ncbi:hypothetical protein F4803DRAFT_546396 [Xylaria telfairii]|nr:hypothetical protein F4803DRAFT_546396 [Xylaria telfairii]
MGEDIDFCDAPAQKQIETSPVQSNRVLQPQGSYLSQIDDFATYPIAEVVEAIPESLGEFSMLNDVLTKSSEGTIDRWLTSEGMKAKKLNSKYWADLASELRSQLLEELKEALLNRERGIVVGGKFKDTFASPIVGVLLATKKTRADMESLQEEAYELQSLAPQMLETPRVTEEELRNTMGDDYNDKLLWWGADVKYMYNMTLANDVAMIRYTRDLEAFWSIDAMAVLASERSKGVGREMVGKVKERATAENLPIVVCAEWGAVAFYEKCGFRVVGSVAVRGNFRGRSDAIMKWVGEAAD